MEITSIWPPESSCLSKAFSNSSHESVNSLPFIRALTVMPPLPLICVIGAQEGSPQPPWIRRLRRTLLDEGKGKGGRTKRRSPYLKGRLIHPLNPLLRLSPRRTGL